MVKMTREEFGELFDNKDTSGIIDGIKDMMEEELNRYVSEYTDRVIEEEGFVKKEVAEE